MQSITGAVLFPSWRGAICVRRQRLPLTAPSSSAFAVGSRALAAVPGEQSSPASLTSRGRLVFHPSHPPGDEEAYFSPLPCAEIARACRKSPRLQMVSHWLIKGETLFWVWEEEWMLQ